MRRHFTNLSLKHWNIWNMYMCVNETKFGTHDVNTKIWNSQVCTTVRSGGGSWGADHNCTKHGIRGRELLLCCLRLRLEGSTQVQFVGSQWHWHAQFYGKLYCPNAEWEVPKRRVGGVINRVIFRTRPTNIEKAFDTVKFPTLLHHVFSIGINGKSWHLIKAWYQSPTSHAKHNDW